MNVTREREWTPSRYLDRPREVAMLQATKICIIQNINNMETIADSRVPKRNPEQNLADLLAYSGLRAQLRLRQQLLRSKDGSGLW